MSEQEIATLNGLPKAVGSAGIEFGFKHIFATLSGLGSVRS
jgi:ribonuclease PH